MSEARGVSDVTPPQSRVSFHRSVVQPAVVPSSGLTMSRVCVSAGVRNFAVAVSRTRTTLAGTEKVGRARGAHAATRLSGSRASRAGPQQRGP